MSPVIRQRWMILLFACVLGAAGCIPTAPKEAAAPATPVPVSPKPSAPTKQSMVATMQEEPLPETEEGLVAEWMKLAENAESNHIMMRPSLLAGALAQKGDTALTPLIDVIGDPKSNPHQKVFAVQSMAQYIGPAYLGRLKEFVNTSQDETTRACAVMLIARMSGGEETELLRELQDDADRRVRLAVLVGLLNRGDESAHQDLIEWYGTEDATHNEKTQIISALLQNPGEKDFEVLGVAVLDPDTDIYMRGNIALLFGRQGGEPQLKTLESGLTQITDPVFKNMAQAAVGAIRARLDAAATANDSANDKTTGS